MLNWWMVNSGRRREVKVPAGRLLKVDETPKRCREKIKANKLRENLKHFKNMGNWISNVAARLYKKCLGNKRRQVIFKY